MRIASVLAGVSGLVAISSLAHADVVWQTVINENQTITEDSSATSTQEDPLNAPDTFQSATQVVLGAGGSVAVIGQDQNDNNVVLYQAAGANTVQTLTSAGDSIGGHELDNFDNLAVSSNPSSGTRVTYVGSPGSGNSVGVFQQDIGSAAQEVAYGGDNGINLSTSTIPSAGTLAIQVNNSGQVVFAGTNSGGKAVVLLGSGNSPTTTLYTASNTTGDLASAANRLGLYGNGVGFGVINNPTSNISSLAGASPTSISGSAAVGQLLAASSVGSTGSVIYTATDASNSNQTDLELYNGSTKSLGSYVASSVSANSPLVAAEVTTGGDAAFYLPDANGGSLQFYNGSAASVIATTSSATSPVDHVIDPSNPGADDVIDQLSLALATPMVNNNGIVVFDGEIEDLSLAHPTDHQALLEWDNGTLSVLLQAGQTLPGLGTIDPDGILVNSLNTESDVQKDSLTDDNYLGVIVSYDSGSYAVIETLLPEPTIALSLGIAAAPLLMRRRRRTVNS